MAKMEITLSQARFSAQFYEQALTCGKDQIYDQIVIMNEGNRNTNENFSITYSNYTFFFL